MQERNGLRMLDPEIFSFFGFGDEAARLRQRIQQVGVRYGDPVVEIVEDVVFIPPTRHRRGQFAYEGGLVDGEGQPIASVNLRRRGAKTLGGLQGRVELPPYDAEEEEVVYLGWLFDHFGHFLLESLARTWILREVDPVVPVVFHRVGPPHVQGTICRILQAFGVSEERLRFITKPTRIRRMIVPEALYEISYQAHEAAGQPYQEVAARILDTFRPSPSVQPVYLSRSRLPSGKRPVVGEVELDDWLMQAGVKVVYPERLTFEEQIVLFNQYTDIITTDGSAAHMAMFALGGPRLHFLTADNPLPDYFLVPTLAGATATFVKCLGDDGRGIPSRHFPYLIDAAAVSDYLKGSERFRATISPVADVRDDGIPAQYAESWYYVRLGSGMEPSGFLDRREEIEARRLAETSWPLCLKLARYYSSRERTQVDYFVTCFSELVRNESDDRKLARYGADVEAMARAVRSHCSPIIARELDRTIQDYFQNLTSNMGDSASTKARPRETVWPVIGRKNPPVLITNHNRAQLLRVLPKGGNVAEIGVFRGIFSVQIRRVAQPNILHLIDPWSAESGSGPMEGPRNESAFEEVQTIFRDDIKSGGVVLHRRYSTDIAAEFPEGYFDWIYVDAMHDYKNVLEDLISFKNRVKEDGFILGHDFSNSEMSRKRAFGVVRAVREFAMLEGWQLVLLTNEANPSYLLAKTSNDTTLPSLRNALINCSAPPPIEIKESLLDHFEQVDVTCPNGRKGRMMRFG